jgi:hypothetical protein
MGDYADAQAVYEKVIETHQQQGSNVSFVVGAWVGIADLRLHQDNQKEAREAIQRAYEYMQSSPRLDGAFFRFRIFRKAWEILLEIDEKQAGASVLELAGIVLREYLDSKPGPAAKERFLSQSDQRILWNNISNR